MTDEPCIVAAVMTAVADMPGGLGTPGLAQQIEAAMVQAVYDALAEGISIHDSATLLARKQAARAAVLQAVRG